VPRHVPGNLLVGVGVARERAFVDDSLGFVFCVVPFGFRLVDCLHDGVGLSSTIGAGRRWAENSSIDTTARDPASGLMQTKNHKPNWNAIQIGAAMSKVVTVVFRIEKLAGSLSIPVLTAPLDRQN
jgi:hypothetical protein